MKLIDLTAYKAVDHVRQFDGVPTFCGQGSGPYPIALDLDAITSIEPCSGQDGARGTVLDDFFVVTVSGGQQHIIDADARAAIVAAKNA